jgi:hypothetical protein
MAVGVRGEDASLRAAAARGGRRRAQQGALEAVEKALTPDLGRRLFQRSTGLSASKVGTAPLSRGTIRARGDGAWSIGRFSF